MNGADLHNLTPSDLIYLFVDGEASDIERTVLFNALVGNTDLQGELADAIRINSAAQQEMFETLPPASVTRALFRRVESLSEGAPAAGAFAGAAVAERGLAPDRSPALSGTDQPKRNRRPLGAFLPLLTGALGMVLGLLLFGGDDPPVLDQRAQIAAGRSANQPDYDGAQVNAREEAAPDVPEHSARFSEEIADNSPTSLQSRGPSQNNASRSNRTEEVRDANHSVRNERQISDSIPPEEVEHSGRLFEDLAVTTPRFTLRRSEVRLDREEIVERSLFPTLEREEPRGEDEDVAVSFFMRGGNEMGFYPERVGEDHAVRENLQNLAIGGYYHLDGMHSIGLQGGRDYHPFYVGGPDGGSTLLDVGSGSQASNQPAILSQVGGGGGGGNIATGFADSGTDEENVNLLNNSKNLPLPNVGSGTGSALPSERGPARPVATLDATIEWIGLGYRFSGPGFDRRGLIRPEFQAAIGMSSVGPVGRASLGLSWKPGTHVSLTAGVEGTGVLYRLDGEMYSSRRIGVVYGVEVGW